MTSTLDAKAFQAELQRLDTLLREVERSPDPLVRAHTRELVQIVLALHGAGLERIVGHLTAAGETGAGIHDACVQDEVVAGLLLLHGLHPLDLETRVRQALEQVKPYLRSHGGSVELVDVSDGVVRLRLQGSCDGCPSLSVTMKQTIEEAILGKAPDAVAVEVEGLVDEAPAAANEAARFALPLV